MRTAKQHREADGSVRLEGTNRSVAAVIFLFVFSIGWNAIVFLLLVPEAVEAWKGGIGFFTVVTIAFATLFGMVGMLIVALFLYTALALFNPTVHLRASSDELRPGETLNLEWHLRGGRTMPHRLRIELCGTETAEYREGTDTRTDQYDFLKQEIENVTDRTRIISHRAQLTIPEGLVPTFEAANNRVTYAITFHGDVSFWPDLYERFNIRILPWADSTVGTTSSHRHER